MFLIETPAADLHVNQLTISQSPFLASVFGLNARKDKCDL